jgi:hypothetical protein
VYAVYQGSDGVKAAEVAASNSASMAQFSVAVSLALAVASLALL